MSTIDENKPPLLDDAYLQSIGSRLKITYDPKLEIRVLDVDERGIFSKDTIPPNTTLAKIPFDSLLTIYSAKEVPELKSWITTSGFREDDLLSILLLYHQTLGSESKFQQHIELLPKEYHNIVNYSDEDLEKIKGSNLHVLGVSWKAQVKNDFQLLQELINKQKSSVKSFFKKINLTFDRYLWGLSTIWSRFISVTYENNQVIRAMVPLIDFLNHSTSSTIGHQYSIQDKHFYIFNNGEIPSSQEIFLNYGNASNSRLLMLYGFTLPENPFDTVSIYATMPPPPSVISHLMNPAPEDLLKDKQQMILHKLKCKILENKKIFPLNNQGYEFPLSLGNLSSELLIFLRLQSVSNEEVRSSFASINENIHQLLSNDNERQVLVNLKGAIQDMINAYGTSLEDDENELIREGFLIPVESSLDGNKKGKPIFQFKHQFVAPKHHNLHSLFLIYGEKFILHSVIDLIDEKLKALESK